MKKQSYYLFFGLFLIFFFSNSPLIANNLQQWSFLEEVEKVNVLECSLSGFCPTL